MAENLAWLRRLLEDQGERHVESAVAGGPEFYVRNPPMSADPPEVVSVAGGVRTAGVHYDAYPDRIVFRAGFEPPVNAMVQISYTHQTFPDAELQDYLAAAQSTLGVTDQHLVVYRAAVFAIDALLMGTATSLRFGAGAEDFDMPSVHARLLELRRTYLEAVATELEEMPSLVIADMTFPSRDPEYPGGFPDDLYWTTE